MFRADELTLGHDRLSDQRASIPCVRVLQVANDSGFTPSSESLAESDKLLNGLKVVLVGTWLCASALENVGNERSVTDLLLCHETDQRDVLLVQSLGSKLLRRKARDTVVEEITGRQLIHSKRCRSLTALPIPGSTRGCTTESRLGGSA